MLLAQRKICSAYRPGIYAPCHPHMILETDCIPTKELAPALLMLQCLIKLMKASEACCDCLFYSYSWLQTLRYEECSDKVRSSYMRPHVGFSTGRGTSLTGVGGDSVSRDLDWVFSARDFNPGMQGKMEAAMTATILQASMMGRKVARTVAMSAQIRLSTTHHVKYACKSIYLQIRQRPLLLFEACRGKSVFNNTFIWDAILRHAAGVTLLYLPQKACENFLLPSWSVTLEKTPAGRASSGQRKRKTMVRLPAQIHMRRSIFLSSSGVSSAAVSAFCKSGKHQASCLPCIAGP